MPGDCHYLEGNVNARRRIEYLQKLLHEIGLEPERVRMANLSSAMGARFVEIAAEMTQKIMELGPNPLKDMPSVVPQTANRLPNEDSKISDSTGE